MCPPASSTWISFSAACVAGNLIILAARPAVGKTSFAMNLAANAAKSGAPVAFFSLEMSSNEITQRLLAAEAGLALSRMRNGQLTEGDWSQLIQASSDLSNCELYVDDSAGLSIVELRTKARRMMRNKKNGLIIVDYLQLMQPVIPHPNNRAVEVAEISRGLKVGKGTEVPIISLSQLSRGVESRTDKRPMLSDLRESGSIEQDADIVMFIDRSTTEAEAESDSRPDWGKAELLWRRIVAARRAISRLRSSLNSLSSLITSTIRGTSLIERQAGLSTITFIHAADLHLGAPFKGLPRKFALVGRRSAEGHPRCVLAHYRHCYRKAG